MKKKLIKFNKERQVQEFANKYHDGNFTKAVNALCEATLALEQLTKVETK